MENNFVSLLKEHANKTSKIRDKCSNEEQTKMSLILPLIALLGYDITNPDEVVLEYETDVPGIKKNKGESVDIAICNSDKTVRLLIEAKTASEKLDNHCGQLFRYFSVSECCHAILTNGIDWWFYSDIDKDNVMDSEPYRKVDMTNLSSDDYSFISGFRKEEFSNDNLKMSAANSRYSTKILEKIEEDIFENPSDDFVRLLLSNDIVKGIKTAKKIAEFKPLVKEMLDLAVSHKYNVESNLTRNSEDTLIVDSEIKNSDVKVFLKNESKANKSQNYDATGIFHMADNTLTIVSGSQISQNEKNCLSDTAKQTRRKYVDNNGVTTQDILCSSVSQAGEIVRGNSTNGWHHWIVEENNQRLGDYIGRNTSSYTKNTDERRKENRIKLWQEFQDHAFTDSRFSSLFERQMETDKFYLTYGGFVGALIKLRPDRVGCEIYFHDKQKFYNVKAKKHLMMNSDIYEWREMEDSARIIIETKIDLSDDNKKQLAFEWLKTHIIEMYNAFKAYL